MFRLACMQMRAFLFFCLSGLLVFSTPAVAAETRDKKIVIDTSKCRFATRHQPAPDVAFKPGVDVHGNAVVPADVNGGQVFQPPARVPIQLLIPLSELLANPPAGLGDANIDLGLLEVEIATGRLFLNGKPAFATHFLVCEGETGKTGN